MKYYERNRELKEEKNLPMKAIAHELGISQQTYNEYEKDYRSRIPVERLILLALFYDVSMDYISGVSNIRKSYPKE
ncbi:helix-turn-helix domain-containing protein [Oribacterium sp. NK2B42]|uniref:helix-turn-helix domain-containing protein n=1 Tax=Oribacterium sp. NK2B42 TaxID=689781 RepID=UPI0004923BE9|nr:helix-turn-helix transcriptional regulator [Oribacterium sp. NK2B42]